MDIVVMAAKNQIADLYYVEVKKAGKKKKRVKKGTMAEIMKKLMKENNIEGQTISTSAIKNAYQKEASLLHITGPYLSTYPC